MQILNRDALIPIEARVELIRRLQAAGLAYIEVGSFVNPKVVPAMGDTARLADLVDAATYKGELAALVPNMRNFELFEATGSLNTVALFVSAAEGYSQKNTRMSVRESLDQARQISEAAIKDGYKVRAHVSAAFRDLTESNGPTSEQDVVQVSEELIHMGCEVVALADTDGRATPLDIARVISAVDRNLTLERIGVHIHDRYGLGLVNAKVAYDLGVRIFDSAVGGIGGNQAVRRSVGNIATEELVNMFHEMNVDTGIDMPALISAGELIYEMTKLVGDPPPPSKFLQEEIERTRSIVWPERIAEIGNSRMRELGTFLGRKLVLDLGDQESIAS
jgi:hydroxymethylglutaryl-CoA lyase